MSYMTLSFSSKPSSAYSSLEITHSSVEVEETVKTCKNLFLKNIANIQSSSNPSNKTAYQVVSSCLTTDPVTPSLHSTFFTLEHLKELGKESVTESCARFTEENIEKRVKTIVTRALNGLASSALLQLFSNSFSIDDTPLFYRKQNYSLLNYSRDIGELTKKTSRAILNRKIKKFCDGFVGNFTTNINSIKYNASLQSSGQEQLNTLLNCLEENLVKQLSSPHAKLDSLKKACIENVTNASKKLSEVDFSCEAEPDIKKNLVESIQSTLQKKICHHLSNAPLNAPISELIDEEKK